MGNDGNDACALCNHVGHLLWHLIGRPPRGSQRYLRIIGRDLRIIGYVRHGVWRQMKALNKQEVLGHDSQLSTITYNHFGTYIHRLKIHGNGTFSLQNVYFQHVGPRTPAVSPGATAGLRSMAGGTQHVMVCATSA